MGPAGGVGLEHEADEVVEAGREGAGLGDAPAVVEDLERAVLEGVAEERGLVEEAAERPDVGALAHELLAEEVAHLGRAVRHRRVALDVVRHQLPRALVARHARARRRAPKVAQLPRAAPAQHVLDLDVAVRDGGLLRVHERDALAHVQEDREQVRLRERPRRARVQRVQQRAPVAELHHKHRVVARRARNREERLQLHDVRVSRKLLLCVPSFGEDSIKR